MDKVTSAMQGLGLTLAKANDYIGQTPGHSTIYSLKIAPGSTVYRYDVEIKKPQTERRPEKVLTKQNDAGLRTAQREACSDIIAALHASTNGFGVGARYVYDGKALLYTSKPIELQRQTTRIESEKVNARAAIFLRGDAIDVTVVANESVANLDYSNLKKALVTNVTEHADRTARTFLEVLTSQPLVQSGLYEQVSAGTLFDTQTQKLVPGMQTRQGFKKGVRVTEEGGPAKALLVVDMKRTAFFAAKNVAEIYSDFLNEARSPRDQQTCIRKFERHMRTVRCVIVYDTSRSFMFDKLTREVVSSKDYYVKGISIVAYMQKEKNLTIDPSLPGCHPLQPQGHKVVYPLDAIRVLRGQVVPVEKLTDMATRILLTNNAVQPNDRYAYTHQRVQEMASGESAKFLDSFGVTIEGVSNVVRINQRRTPKILYGLQKNVTPAPNGSWFREAVDAPFIDPSTKISKWVVAYDPSLARQEIESYIKQLMMRGQKSGMKIAAPLAFEATSLDGLEALFKKAQNSIQFIFFIDHDRAPSHKRLKLYEAYYKVLTQHVVAKNIRGRGPNPNAPIQTLQNVAMKLNCKAFGLNYVPVMPPKTLDNYSLSSPDLLVIGMDASHPTRATPKELFELKKNGLERLTNSNPSVVGICANKAANPAAFAPDFFYQESRKEAISPIRLRAAVAQIVQQVQKAGRTPKRIIVLRDGLSEDQMEMAVRDELPAIRAGYNDGITRSTPDMINYHPRISFVVATKMHDKRFYRADQKIVSNTMPGDVVDAGVVRTDIPEFFMQSHFPLKGVPKMLQLSVLVNELGMSASEIQAFVNYCSSMHQVCACPTALPVPIYLAKETAKRGMAIYEELAYLKRTQNAFPEVKNQGPGVYDFDSLTALLSYGKSKLATTRFNA